MKTKKQEDETHEQFDARIRQEFDWYFNKKDKSFTAHDDAISDGCVMCGNEWKSLNKDGYCSSCWTVWKS